MPATPAGSASRARALLDALDVRGDGIVVSLVGAGGKTSLMWALAAALVAEARTVVTTTTTRIYPPTAEQSAVLLLVGDEPDPIAAIRRALGRSRHVTVGTGIPDGKLRGLAPALLDRVAAERVTDAIVVEADGAAGRPLKAARAGEPVLPACSTLVVAVVGIDALGRPLDESSVFRSALAAEITGLAPGEPVTPDAAAALLLGARGVTAHAPASARVIVYVNKVERAAERAAAHDLARRLFALAGRRLSRVVLGSLTAPAPDFTVLAP